MQTREPRRSPSREQRWSPEKHDQLLKVARKVAKNAYAPYSKFKVGAAALTTQGRIVAGCNVENASYGLTICAERAAIFAAVAEFGARVKICMIAIVNDKGAPCPPCGACRQVINEFGKDATVVFQGSRGMVETAIKHLLPEGFRLK